MTRGRVVCHAFTDGTLARYFLPVSRRTSVLYYLFSHWTQGKPSLSKCAAQTFPHFNRDCLSGLRTRLQIETPDPTPGSTRQVSGQGSRAGFTIAWSYELDSELLTVQCIGSPFFVPCSAIEPQMRNWVLACYPAFSKDSGSTT